MWSGLQKQTIFQKYHSNVGLFSYLCCMDETLNVIQRACSLWEYNLKLGRKYNTPLSIGFSDGYYELLTCVEHNIKGTGSISHGYDHDNHDETKGTSWVQPKKCNTCNAKIHFFSEKCICGSNDIKYINDSRWGIDAKAHFDHKVPNYHLWVLYPKTYSYDCNVFYLKQFIIKSENNEVFNNILRVQLERSDSKHKNFLPFSSDFYASNPKEISSFTITFNDVFGVFVSRNNVNEIIYDNEVIKQMTRAKIIDMSFVNYKDTYLYEELYQFINVKDKPTTHGKERGTTSRRNQ
jgi:hypothetical protein